MIEQDDTLDLNKASASNDSPHVTLKLLMVGDSKVGKTTIVRRFCDEIFLPATISTLGIDFKIKTIDLKGQRIKLQIWDSAGQERFHSITTSYFRGASGILLVYDITNTNSFDNIAKWLRDIEKHASFDVKKVLLGNKCDLADQREVSMKRGQDIAREHDIHFLETSAKTNANIDQAFHDLVVAILDKMPSKSDGDTNVVVRNTDQTQQSKSRCC